MRFCNGSVFWSTELIDHFLNSSISELSVPHYPGSATDNYMALKEFVGSPGFEMKVAVVSSISPWLEAVALKLAQSLMVLVVVMPTTALQATNNPPTGQDDDGKLVSASSCFANAAPPSSVSSPQSARQK